MLFALSALIGCPIEASDGRIGTVKDFLFDDDSWRVRWMVADTGTWLTGRQMLIHPSAIEPLDLTPPSGSQLPMMGTGRELTLSVRLTKTQIEAAPDVSEDQPVSRETEVQLYDYYGWDPTWGTSFFGTAAIATAGLAPSVLATPVAGDGADTETRAGDGDPHRRSVAAVKGYHVHATDGDIGHIENFLADDVGWDIRYLVLATRDWWPGKHVLLSPYAVVKIDRRDRHIHLNVTRDQVKASPPWDPAAMIDQTSEERLHRHYGWQGYGW